MILEPYVRRVIYLTKLWNTRLGAKTIYWSIQISGVRISGGGTKLESLNWGRVQVREEEWWIWFWGEEIEKII